MSGRNERSIKADRPDDRSPDRDSISLGEDSAFNLPRSFLDKYPDKSFCFVPYMCGGVELVDDYYDAVHKRRFEPVLISNYPELSRRTHQTPFMKKDEDELVKVKGQVLMVRSLDDKKAEDKKYDEYNARQEKLKALHTMNPQNPTLMQDERRWQSVG